MKGILDRFEKDVAVILIEEENEELIVPKESLPAGSKVNTYFTLKKTSDGYKIIEIDEGKTAGEAAKTSSLMEQLRAKKKTSKFKK